MDISLISSFVRGASINIGLLTFAVFCLTKKPLFEGLTWLYLSALDTRNDTYAKAFYIILEYKFGCKSFPSAFHGLAVLLPYTRAQIQQLLGEPFTKSL